MLIMTISSCLTTLHPLFKPGDVCFDENLLGSWRVDKENDTLTFCRATAANFEGLPEELKKLSSKAYELQMGGWEEEQLFLAFLFKIGKNTYLDLYPMVHPKQKPLNSLFMAHYLRTHTVYKVKLDRRGLDMRALNGEFVEELITKNKLRIRHEQQETGGSLLLTASTDELQQYVLKYGDTDAAFEAVSHYKRLN